jgi:hypothetical protein
MSAEAAAVRLERWLHAGRFCRKMNTKLPPHLNLAAKNSDKLKTTNK